jgi:hypothetical protein
MNSEIRCWTKHVGLNEIENFEHEIYSREFSLKTLKDSINMYLN